MAAARTYGVPLTTFRAWSDEDQAMALAYETLLDRTCAGCGTREDEWAADRDAWVGHITRCPGCQRIGEEQDNINEAVKQPGQSSHGLRISLLPAALAEQVPDALAGS